MEEYDDKAGLPVEEYDDKTGLSVEEYDDKTGLSVEEYDDMTGLPVEEYDDKTGLPVEEYDDKTDLPVEEYDDKTGLSVDEYDDKTGLPVGEYDDKTGLTVEEYNDKTGLPVEEYDDKTDLPVEEYDDETGLPVEEYDDMTGLPVEEYDDKTGLPVDILSFLLHITVPGYCITRCRLYRRYQTKAKTWSRQGDSSYFEGWHRRLMGSIPDGLYLPQTYQPETVPIEGEHEERELKKQTDHDAWMWRPELPVGFMPTSAPLIADTSGCPPGYARVKLNTTASAEQIISRYPINKILTHTVVDGQKLIQFNYKQLLISYFSINDPNEETKIDGPAINRHSTIISMDDVPVLICKEWPELGQRWERRQRRSGWPSPEFISDVKKLGCDFVQVPSHNSTNPEVEWRIAFSLIEQKLCQSFTTVQKKCFIIAKLIMKRNLEICEGYSTYLLKNSMFWMMEDIVSTDWQEENALARFIILLLDTFQGYLEKRNLPHYFIEERNLIEHIPKNICDEMIEKIDNVRNSLHIHVLLHCNCFFPIQLFYDNYKEHCFSLFHTTLRYSPDVKLNLMKKILRFMLINLVSYDYIELLVTILKQHGDILDPQVHHPASTCGDEKTWILQKVGDIFTDLDVPEQNILSRRLSGMLCLYYYSLHRDKSLLKPAFNHFRDALNQFSIIRFDRYVCKFIQQVYIWQVLALKAAGDYQQALDLITFARNNDQFEHNPKITHYIMMIPADFFGLLDTLITDTKYDMFVCVHDISMYLSVQLLVLMDRFNEADSAMEYWRIKAPACMIHIRSDDFPSHYYRQLLVALAYLWASNFSKAASVFESMNIHRLDFRTGNIHGFCTALSVGGTGKIQGRSDIRGWKKIFN